MISANTLFSPSSRWKAAALAMLAAFTLGAPEPAAAQMNTLGAAVAGHGFASRGTDPTHDPINNVFLVVSSFVEVRGVFVNAQGTPVTGPFQISSGAGHVNFTRARYSPDVNNGLGGFLVVWSSEEGKSVNARARVVSYPGTLGAEHVISDGGTQAWLESAPAVAYSSTSRQFLVAWGGVTGVKARLVDVSGAGVGSIVQLSAGYGRDPGVTWNPLRNDFGVSFSGESGPSAYSAFAVVPASNPAAFSRRTFNFIPGGLTYITDVDFNPHTRRYVMTWFEFVKARVAEIDENGIPVADGVASFSVGSYDALSVAFNPVSKTFMLVGINPKTDAQSALQLNGVGFPFGGEQTIANAPAVYSRVAASQTAPVWLSTYARGTSGPPMVQALQSSAAAGGPAGGYGASAGVPPPPTPGTPPTSTGCPGDIPGMICVNGTWMPGTMTPPPTGNTGGCPGDIPGMTCVNGTWVPGTSAGGGSTNTGGCPGDIPGMTCVNGTWVPGAPAGGGSNTGGCPGFIPNMTCVNGNWVIGAPSGGGSGNNGGCPGDIPGMVCVNGTWLPASAAPGGGSSSGCPGFIPNMTCVNGNWVVGAPSAGGGSGGTGDCPGFIPNMTCVNGNWVVGAPVSNNPGGLCPGDIPGQVCVGGIWMPAGSSSALSSSSSLPVCTGGTSAPVSGWVRIGTADWLPPDHPLAAQATCRGQ